MRHVQLRAFHHVALSGGFSRAAEALHLTQPAVSDQVRKLEEDYAVVLFNRAKRQVRLTPAGEALFEVTRRLFAVEGEAREFLEGARLQQSGRLRLLADATGHVLHILAAFRARHPGVAVTIRSGNSAQVLDELWNFEADIGVVAEVPEGAGLEVLPLGDAPLIAFAARGSPWDAPGMTLAEAAAAPMVMREPASKTRRLFEEDLARHGLTANVVIEAEGRESVREIVASGAGIGIVSAAEFGQDQRLVAIPLSDSTVRMTEAVIWLAARSRSQSVARFLDVARAVTGAAQLTPT